MLESDQEYTFASYGDDSRNNIHQPELVNVFVLVLKINVRVGVVVVAEPTGTEPATFTAYVAAGPLPEATNKPIIEESMDPCGQR